MRIYDSLTQLILTILIAIVGLFVLTSCQSGTGLLPRNPDGTVDWEETERIRREIKEVRDAREDAEQDAPSESPSDNQSKQGNVSDSDEITWLEQDISGWPVVTELRDVTVSNGAIRYHFDSSKFPADPKLEARGGGAMNGNFWVIVDRKAVTWEFARVGQTSKSLKAFKAADGHINFRELAGWEPKSGEIYGFLFSSIARGGYEVSHKLRTNIIYREWP